MGRSQNNKNDHIRKIFLKGEAVNDSGSEVLNPKKRGDPGITICIYMYDPRTCFFTLQLYRICTSSFIDSDAENVFKKIKTKIKKCVGLFEYFFCCIFLPLLTTSYTTSFETDVQNLYLFFYRQ